MEYIKAKSILQKTGAEHFRWFGIEYNMNLYRGCCHGCIYCDSRSNCYHIEEFDTIRLKSDIPTILEKELKTKRKTGVVGIGAMSDTYNPFERKHQSTRTALKLLDEYGFGISIDTKSDLVLRDIDIIEKIAKKRQAIIKLTITTVEDSLSKIIEPHVCNSTARFNAIRELSNHGIYSGILFTPMLPFITDTEENVREMVAKAYEHGAKFVYPSFGVTLRENQKDYYYERLEEYFPNLKNQYIETYGNAYVCNSKKKQKLSELLKRECEKYGLLYNMNDIIKAYNQKQEYKQLTLDF